MLFLTSTIILNLPELIINYILIFIINIYKKFTVP